MEINCDKLLNQIKQLDDHFMFDKQEIVYAFACPENKSH